MLVYLVLMIKVGFGLEQFWNGIGWYCAAKISAVEPYPKAVVRLVPPPSIPDSVTL